MLNELVMSDVQQVFLGLQKVEIDLCNQQVGVGVRF
jgi:hypothetical protein